ncbi:MAG: ankyrin repeat domain-containing protein [Sedimentisphaerales bacterium]|nr:ankyrin repeat domain-containing protein [Sedimentisphaerales bacterium]
MKHPAISLPVLFFIFSFINIAESAGLSQITDVLSVQKELVNPDSEDTTVPKIDYVTELNKLGLAGHSESDNAAPYYQKAIELYIANPDSLRIKPGQWPKDYSAQEQAMLKKWIQDNSRALEQLQLAGQKSYCWNKHTGQKLNATEKITKTTNESSNFTTIRQLAFALQNRAMLSAEDGNVTSALGDIETLYTIGAQMVTGPKLLIEKLLGLAVKNLPIRTVLDMLDRKMIDNAMMKSLEDRFKEIVSSYREPIDFRGEKIYLQEQINTDPIYAGFKPHLKNTLAQYDTMAAKTPMQIHNEPAQSVNENNPLQFLAPPFAKIIENEYKTRTYEDALLTTLALLRYNAATDSYPGTLQQLVSGGYLKEVPVDPFSGNPLVYKKSMQGFTLYSFATDYDDDGGKPSKWGAGEEGGDQVFWPLEQTQIAQQTSSQTRPYPRTEPQAEQRNLTAQNNQNSDKTLTEAVAEGDINQARSLLSQGAEINQKNRMGWTLLHMAVRNQNKEIAELLTTKGADMNLTDNRGQTPLHLAVNTGQKEMVQLLVSKGADVNVMIGQDNALTLARKKRYTEIADILTQNGGREPTREELMADRYLDYSNNQQQTGASLRNRRGNRATDQPAEADILADPNEIKARIKTFAGLQKVLDTVDANSQNEQRQWLYTRYDNRTMLLRTVQKQFEDEISVIRTISVAEKAQRTTEAIDSALPLRQERFKLIGRELMTQRREQRESQQTTRTRGGRSRTSAMGSRGQGEQYDNYDSGGYGRNSTQQPYGRSDSMGRPSGRGAYPTTRTPQQPDQEQTIDREAEDESRQWLQADIEDKSDLAAAVNDQIQMEITAIRRIAVEEQAKKTTAAIDGILLARQNRLDEFLTKMEEQQLTERQQTQNQRPGTSGRYQQEDRYNRGQTSTRGGSTSGYQQGNQRARRRR